MEREKSRRKVAKGSARSVCNKLCRVLEKESELLCGCGVTLAGGLAAGALRGAAEAKKLARASGISIRKAEIFREMTLTVHRSNEALESAKRLCLNNCQPFIDCVDHLLINKLSHESRRPCTEMSS